MHGERHQRVGHEPAVAPVGTCGPGTRVPTRPPSRPSPLRPGASLVTFSAPADDGTPITSYTATCVSSNGGVPAAQTGASSPITVAGCHEREDLHLHRRRNERDRHRRVVAPVGRR